jgi:hypothetical protein
VLSPQTPSGERTTIDPAIDVVKNRKDDTQNILFVTKVVKWAMAALAVLLVLASVLLISNTIRLSLFARRREVEVMKLVGARTPSSAGRSSSRASSWARSAARWPSSCSAWARSRSSIPS